MKIPAGFLADFPMLQLIHVFLECWVLPETQPDIAGHIHSS